MKHLFLFFSGLLLTGSLFAQLPPVLYDLHGATITRQQTPDPVMNSWSDAGNSWTPVGPFGGDVVGLTTDPLTPGLLFAAAGTPFFSDDSGANWMILESLATITTGSVNSIQSIANGYLFATDPYNFGKVFRSMDGGVTWQSRTIPVNSGGLCLAADPNDNETIYVGLQSNMSSATNKVVVRSTDGGTTWTAFDLTSVLPVGYGAVSVAVDPSDNQTIVVVGNSGFSDALVAASFDGGTTWSDITSNLPPGVPYNDAAMANNTIYIAGGQLFGSQYMGLYQSTDDGLTWTNLSATFPNQVANAILIDPVNPDHLFVATEGDGIYFSTDAGSTWDFTGSGAGENGAARCLMLLPGSSTTLFAGFLSLAVCKTEDAASTWTFANTGIATLQVDDIEVNPLDPQVVLVGFEAENSGGCYMSTDGAVTWNLVGGLPGTRFSQVTVGSDGSLYAWSNGPTTIAPEGLYKSMDNGVTWANTGPDIGSLFETQIFALTASAVNPGLLFIGGNNFGVNGWEPVIYRTGNGGQTWINTWIGPSDGGYSIRYLFIDPTSNDQVIYAAYKSEETGGILKSTDGGFSWNEIGNTIPGTYKYAGAIVCNPVDPLTLLAGCGGYGNPGTIYRSADGGTTWTGTSLSMGTYSRINDIMISPANPFVVYVASAQEGVQLSVDGGMHWEPANEGLAALNITGFSQVYEEGDGRFMYASTYTNSSFGTEVYNPGVAVNDPSADDGIRVYPNPAKGVVTINWSALREKAETLTVHTPAGQVCYRWDATEQPDGNGLLTIHLQPGSYLIQLRAGNTQLVRKIVIY